MRISTFLGLTILFACLASFAADQADSTSAFYNTQYDPAADPSLQLAGAKIKAAETDRRILLDIGGEWCIWCHRMDDLFRANKDLADLLTKHYVIVKINVSKGNENTAFMAQFPKVAGYPHLFVLDANGELVHSQETGQLEEGKGHSREKMAEFLRKWAKQN